MDGKYGIETLEYVDPLDRATSTELASDTDGDRFSLLQEEEDGTNPGNPDSDGDGLGDGWEALYAFVSTFISLHTRATATEVTYDLDNDGLTLLQESEGFTDPRKNDTDDDGLNDSYEFLISGTDGTLTDTDGDGLGDRWEVQYMNAEHVDPLVRATSTQLASDTDGDRLNLSGEAQAFTDPGDPDTDGDGLGDGWEVQYNYISGDVDPLDKALDDVLVLDNDKDGLNYSLEAQAFTHPSLNDTDGDGLNDSYEFLVLGTNATLTDTDGDGLNDSYEVLTLGTNATLADTDGDGLNDSYEVLTLGTNATLADTDGDGLGDRWEVKYNGTSGVNPLVKATAEELASDTDNDGLSLTEEFKANLDPGTADNPMQMSTTASDSSSSDEGGGSLSSFTLPVVLAIFTSFSLVFVIYRMRRRML